MTSPTTASSYRLCRAGGDLRGEIDAAYPKRDRTSDGWVGDPSHQARRSDHNPDYDYNPGVVKALDIDENLVAGDEGKTLDEIAERIRLLGKGGDERLRGGYLIRNGWIAGTHTGWAKHRYTGENGHYGHLHVSFADHQGGFDKLGDWPIVPARPAPEPSPVLPGQHEHRVARIHHRDVGHPAEVRDLQGHLNAWRRNRDLSTHPVDGVWDDWLEVSLRTFQKTYGLTVDGVMDNDDWAMIHKITKGVRYAP